MNDRKLLAFPNHTADPISVGELPSHKPQAERNGGVPLWARCDNGSGVVDSITVGGGAWGDAGKYKTIDDKDFAIIGEGKYHDNLPPSTAIYRFKRVS